MYGSASPSRAVLAGVVGILAFAAGCGDSTSPQEHADVHLIRLTVDGQTVTFDGSTATGGPITIGLGDAAVTTQFLDDAQQPVAVDPAEYQIEILSADEQVVTFMRQTAFAGTMTGVAPGETALAVCLLHLGENHCEIGDRGVYVVQVVVAAEEDETGA